MVAASNATHFGVSMTSGDIYSIVGNGLELSMSDGRQRTSTGINDSWGLAVDSSGNVYVADLGNARIRMVPVSNSTHFGIGMTANDIYTIAGNGTAGNSGDGGTATSAEIDGPQGLGVDSLGNVYIETTYGLRIRMVAANTATYFGVSMTASDIYTVVGNGINGFSGDGGAGTSAKISNVNGGVSFDSSGNVYFGDTKSSVIRKIWR